MKIGLLPLVCVAALASAQPTPNGDVYIANACAHPLRVAVSWEDPLDGWRTEGWWSFAADESSSLKSEDGQVRTENGFLYVYAQATDKSGLVWEADNTDYQENIEGKSYNMVEIELEPEEDGSWVLPLTCN
jgi:uncharacterized membrane protein